MIRSNDSPTLSYVLPLFVFALAASSGNENGAAPAGSGGASGKSGTRGAGAAGGTFSAGTNGVAGTGGATIGGSAGDSNSAGESPGAGGAGGSTAAGGTGGAGAAGGVGGAGGTSASGDIYVSPTGSDANPGTLTAPVQTMVKARDLARTRNSAMTQDLSVYLRGGTYPLASTLTFSNADSGTNGHYVKYVAYSGERPLITGGRLVTGFKDAGNGMFSASGVTSRFRQLYVNGVKAIRAREPDLGANGTPNFNRISGFDKSAHNVQVSSSYVASWNNLTKVEMHFMINWTDNVLRLASYSTSGNIASLKFQSAEDAILFTRPFPQLGYTTTGRQQCFYFENALEFLDQAGEWYLDEVQNVLYYKPRPGEDMSAATVVAPTLETLLSVNGSSTADQAGYLWFEGLTFAHSNYLRPSQYGFLDGQAGQYNLSATTDNKQTVGRPAGGVIVTNANHVHFERNVFTQMAATGLDFVSGTHDDLIIGNVFKDIGGNGISVGKFTASDATEFHIPYDPSDKNEICTRDTIKDNYVTNVTTEIQGACGIAAGYPRSIDIEHNEIAQANYTGISVGFGWSTATNAMQTNKINYNNVHHIANILADGAAIYTLSNQSPSSEMQYNYVHDFSQSQWADYQIGGLYLDEGTTGYTVAHNVFANAPTSIFQNKTGANTLTDNGGSSPGTISGAGIEPAYADIKTMTTPAFR